MRKQQIAVIGLGRFGSSAAIQLASLGYDVLGVDKNEDLVEKMSDELTHVVRADTANEGALEELGIRNFDVVVVGISSDVQSSIVTTLILKHLNVPYVIAKARDELHGEILDRIGADKVIYPEHEAGLRISHTFISRALLDYVEVVPGYGVSKIRVPDRFVGRSLQVLGFGGESGLHVLMIGRNKSVVFDPNPSERIQSGDVLMLVGEDRYLSEMEL